MKKAIIFYCIDYFDKEYKYVVTCDENRLNEVIEENKKHCTDITKYDICNAYDE